MFARKSMVSELVSVGPGTILGESSCLDVCAASEFITIPAGKYFSGAPARCVGRRRDKESLSILREDYGHGGVLGETTSNCFGARSRSAFYCLSEFFLFILLPLLGSAFLSIFMVSLLGGVAWLWRYFSKNYYAQPSASTSSVSLLECCLGSAWEAIDTMLNSSSVALSVASMFILVLDILRALAVAIVILIMVLAIGEELRILVVCLLLRLFDSRTSDCFGVAKPGLYPATDNVRLLLLVWKVRLFDQVQAFLTCRFLAPYYLQLAGVRFDGGCGRSLLGAQFHLIPDLTLVGANSFWCTGASSRQLTYGHFLRKTAKQHDSETAGQRDSKLGEEDEEVCVGGILQRTRYPTEFFMGNFSSIGPCSYATNLVVGTGTSAPAPNPGGCRRQMQARFDPPRTIVGCPPLELRSRVAPESRTSDNDDTDDQCYRPSFRAYIAPFFLVDVLAPVMMVMPQAIRVSVCLLVLGILGRLANSSDEQRAHALLHMTVSAGIMADTFFSFFVLPILLATIKNLAIGKLGVPAGYQPHFSLYIWVSWWLFKVEQIWTAPAFDEYFRGTLILPWYFSLYGCKCGRGVLFDACEMSCGAVMDGGKLDIGDNTVLFGVRMQLHSFEHWQYWSSRTSIGSNCVVGQGAILMGGARIEDNIDIGQNSLVMKNEVLFNSHLTDEGPATVENRRKYFQGAPVQEFRTGIAGKSDSFIPGDSKS